MRSLPFRTRLALATALAVALTVILASVIAYVVVSDTLRSQVDESLRSELNGLRAVTNLLDNAAKWSPRGGSIEVLVGDGSVTVRDHGPGIAPHDLPHVFDRFYRSAQARGAPGSGLGLAIVRQVAEAHGGSVVAENAADRGAIIRLSLPANDHLT